MNASSYVTRHGNRAAMAVIAAALPGFLIGNLHGTLTRDIAVDGMRVDYGWPLPYVSRHIVGLDESIWVFLGSGRFVEFSAAALLSNLLVGSASCLVVMKVARQIWGDRKFSVLHVLSLTASFALAFATYVPVSTSHFHVFASLGRRASQVATTAVNFSNLWVSILGAICLVSCLTKKVKELRQTDCPRSNQ